MSSNLYLSRPMGALASRIVRDRYAWDVNETWSGVAARVPRAVFSAVADRGAGVADLVYALTARIDKRQFLPAGRYLANAGRSYHQVQNCLLLKTEDSREDWGEHYRKHVLGLTTGAGLGCHYGALRPRGWELRRTGGRATGPCSLVSGTNEVARPLRSGKDRHSALWGGLPWWHPDAPAWMVLKNWDEETKRRKQKDYYAWAPLDGTNISLCYDDAFFAAVKENRSVRCPTDWKGESGGAADVFWQNMRQALETGDPGFSIDCGANAATILRNACTEVVSADDSDICNLGSINMAAFDNIEDFGDMVEEGTAFLVAGTIYSDLPYKKVALVREKNRRLGLGLMGVHEWLLVRGLRYEPSAELGEWLQVYKDRSDAAAKTYSSAWNVSSPVANRALAPNGTIGLVAETTTCLEPLLTVACRKQVLRGDGEVTVEYLVDPVAQRLIEQGVAPDAIETAYSLAESLEGVGRRLAMQAWVQQWVDQAIASTVNIGAWGSASNNEDTVEDIGRMVLDVMPRLRGLTFYPDGARYGQPITTVPYVEAMARAGVVHVEQAGDVCEMRGGGSCGA